MRLRAGLTPSGPFLLCRVAEPHRYGVLLDEFTQRAFRYTNCIPCAEMPNLTVADQLVNERASTVQFIGHFRSGQVLLGQRHYPPSFPKALVLSASQDTLFRVRPTGSHGASKVDRAVTSPSIPGMRAESRGQALLAAPGGAPRVDRPALLSHVDRTTRSNSSSTGLFRLVRRGGQPVGVAHAPDTRYSGWPDGEPVVEQGIPLVH